MEFAQSETPRKLYLLPFSAVNNKNNYYNRKYYKMKIVLFYHSLLSDWNHGNAHFLRGIATELIARGNEVVIYEPKMAGVYPTLYKSMVKKQ
jgi:hypothetical protein